jgi:chorismate mutase
MAFFKLARPYIIAGPCGAESEEQIHEVAAALVGTSVQLMRAGVWKPRTRPGSFEGNGEVALQWMQAASKQYGIPMATEVAEPEHVELALKYDIDVLWLGARTTVNPFQVQRIADALRGSGVPVIVKNPVNPDVALWEGAIERLEKAGITDVAVLHRGFSGYTPANGYRNQPNWPIPIELKRRRPQLPLFCDPSHITGNRDRIAEVAQKAMDMHFDGLMIETHPQPELALSDAAQQITPAALKDVLAKLVVRGEHTHDMSAQEQLEHLRQLMDTLDAEIVDLIARRMELSSNIGDVKRQCHMTVYQPARWREIVETRSARGISQGLTADFVTELYEKIHHESIRIQLGML